MSVPTDDFGEITARDNDARIAILVEDEVIALQLERLLTSAITNQEN